MASPLIVPKHAPAKRKASGTVPLPDNTRARLLDAAGQVFADTGYQAATVRQICAHAGVNIALVNYHFGDKLELYTEVLRYSTGAAKNEIIQKALRSDAPPEEALRELIAAMLQRVCGADRPGWHYQLMVHEMAQPTPAMAKVIDETMRPIYDRFRSLIGALLKLPADHDETRLCTHSVIAQIVHYAHSRHVNSQLWPELKLTPARIAQIARFVGDFSLAYIRAAAPARPRREK
jgi:AcrR family transcriptional regulator